MEKKPEDIQLYAQLPILTYADGYVAQIIGMRPSKDKEGKDIWDVVLNPSQELIKRYNLREGSKEVFVREDGSLFLKQQLPFEMVVNLNPDPVWNRWFYLGTYDGKSTPALELLKGTAQQKIISNLKSELLVTQAKLEKAEEQAKLMELDMPRYINRNLLPLVNQMMINNPLIDKLLDKAKLKSD